MQTATRNIVERYADVQPREFGDKLQRSWGAVEQIKDQVIELVEASTLTPIEGLGIIACASAQVFGYAAFHGQTTPADLYTTLSTKAAQRS